MGASVFKFGLCFDEIPDRDAVATVAAFCEVARQTPPLYAIPAVRELVTDWERCLCFFQSGGVSTIFDEFINTESDYDAVMTPMRKAADRISRFQGDVPGEYFRDQGHRNAGEYFAFIPIEAAMNGHARIMRVLTARGDTSTPGLKISILSPSKFSDVLKKDKPSQE